MAANRRELVVAVVSDASQFSRGFDRAGQDVQRFSKKVDQAQKGGLKGLDSRINAVSASFRTLSAVAAGGIIGQKIIGFAKESIDAYSDLNESINAVTVSFGQSAEGVQELGRAASQSLGLSNAAFNSLAVSFSAFTKTIAEGSGRGVVDVLDELTTRAADFASVMNLEVNDAAQKFRSGLAGETEPLRQFGIDLSAAKVNATALALGLADSTSELTEQDKILARYHELMQQTANTAGDFANTSGELANTQRRLDAEIQNTQARIGEKLAPIMAELLKTTEELLPALGDFAGGLAETASSISPLLSGLGDLVGLMSDFKRNNDALVESENPFEAFIGQLTDAAFQGALTHAMQSVDRFVAQFESAPAVVNPAAAAFSDAADNVYRLGSNTQDAADASSDADFRNSTVTVLASQLQDTEEAARNTRLAILELADPAFAAVAARGREADAEARVQKLKEEGATVEEIARAELDLAEARIESFGALERFDAAGVAGQVGLIADALGTSYEQAKELLSTVGLLDGQSIDIPVVFNLSTVGAPPALGEVLNGRPGNVQALPTPSGSSTVNNTVVVNGNADSGTVGQISRELVIQANSSYAEGNFR